MLLASIGWELGAEGWAFQPGGGGGSSGVATASPRTGLQHLRLVANAGYTDSSATYNFGAEFRAHVGHTITFTVWAKRTSGLKDANIQISDGVGGATTQALPTGATYAETAVSRLIGAAATLIQVSVTTTGSYGATWDIDDITIESDWNIESAPMLAGARGRIREWPYLGLRKYGPGLGDKGIPDLVLPHPPWPRSK